MYYACVINFASYQCSSLHRCSAYLRNAYLAQAVLHYATFLEDFVFHVMRQECDKNSFRFPEVLWIYIINVCHSPSE